MEGLGFKAHIERFWWSCSTINSDPYAISGSFTEAGDHALRIFPFPQISKDWGWQRVLGQLTVLILVRMHLMFADHDPGTAMDNIVALPCIIATLVVGGGSGAGCNRENPIAHCPSLDNAATNDS
jgi:hypothetical protein